MVRIRLARFGRRHRPWYRIGAYDAKTARCGRCLEFLGTYDPTLAENDKKVILDRERVVWWLDHGAQPTQTVARILKLHGIYSAK